LTDGARFGVFMPKLLERSIRCVEDRLVLLAPAHRVIPAAFINVEPDPIEHDDRLREIQRLRGDIYFSDGAVQRRDLSSDGRHQTPEDQKSWHLLMLNKERHITACVWYLEHPNTVSPHALRVRACPAGMRKESKDIFWSAVDQELIRAQADGLGYAEVGGWAVTKESRCTSEGLLLALAAYSLGRMLGGALGVTTATVRHSSSTILRRLGGSPLEADGQLVSSYFDPKYQCDMELLRFDSRRPNPKYAPLVEQLKVKLATVTVIGGRPIEARLPIWTRPVKVIRQVVAA
jgi:hypothetical protein